MVRVFLVFLLLSGIVSAELIIPASVSRGQRPFLSSEVWANPAEDWRSSSGVWENTHSGGNRNVVLLTAELVAGAGDFSMSAYVTQLSEILEGRGFVGFQVGLQGVSGDYRESAVSGAGMAAGVTLDGRLFIGDVMEEAPQLAPPFDRLTLKLEGTVAERAALTLTVVDALGVPVASLTREGIHNSWVPGLVALTTSTRPTVASDYESARTGEGRIDQAHGGEARFGWSRWSLRGSLAEARPKRAYGPILWTTYTLTEQGTARILVQMAPVATREVPQICTLRMLGERVTAEIDPMSQTALFEVGDLTTFEDESFTVKYRRDEWKGVVRAIPRRKPLTLISVAGHLPGTFPHVALMESVKEAEPDVISFHGGQVHGELGGYRQITGAKSGKRAMLCYLRKYALHGWLWRDLLAEIPSIALPGAEDVMQSMLWGAGGRLLGRTELGFGGTEDTGGYVMEAEVVNAVHRSQTGNLPVLGNEPEVAVGEIGTYHSRFAYGALDALVLADKQFKSVPAEALSPAVFVDGRAVEGDAGLGAEGAELLGPEQEDFFQSWAGERAEEAPMRVVLTSSPWLGFGGDEGADFDSNGWPGEARKRALVFMELAGALHVSGGHQTGAIGHYGNMTEAGTWWMSPAAAGARGPAGWSISPSESGEDDFGNGYTLLAASSQPGAGYVVTRYEPGATALLVSHVSVGASVVSSRPISLPLRVGE